MLPLDCTATVSPVGMICPSIPEIRGLEPGRDQNVGQLAVSAEQLSWLRVGATVGLKHCVNPTAHVPGTSPVLSG